MELFYKVTQQNVKTELMTGVLGSKNAQRSTMRLAASLKADYFFSRHTHGFLLLTMILPFSVSHSNHCYKI